MKLPNQPKVLAATYNPISGTKMISFLVDFPTVLLAELRTHRILTQGSLYEHMELDDFNMSANCLHPETEINVEYINGNKLSGKKIPINKLYERFVEGKCDNLLLRNLNEITDKIQKVKIKNIWKTIPKQTYTIELSNGKKLTCTKEHRIYSNKGYITLKDLNLSETKNGLLNWDKISDLKIAVNGVSFDADFFIRERDLGKSLTEICKENNYSFKAASTFCEKQRIFFRKKQIINEGSLYKDFEWLSDKLAKGLYSTEIACLSNTTPDKVKKQIRKFGLKGNKKYFLKDATPWNQGKSYKITSEEGILGHKRGAEKRKKYYTEDDLNCKNNFNSLRKNFTSEYLKETLEKTNYNYECPLTGLKYRFDVHHIIPISEDASKAFCKENLLIINRAAHKWLHSNKLTSILKEWINLKKDLSDFIKTFDNDCKKSFYTFSDNINKARKGLFCKYESIVSITKSDFIECYDIEVDGEFKNFVADGVIVHNSARAIPQSKYIQKILDNPFVPIWTKQQKGMTGKRITEGSYYLDNEWLFPLRGQYPDHWKLGYTKQKDLDKGYFDGNYSILENIEYFKDQDVHKQNINRILAPYAWTTCIISGTEWENFFELRCPKYEFGGIVARSKKRVI